MQWQLPHLTNDLYCLAVIGQTMISFNNSFETEKIHYLLLQVNNWHSEPLVSASIYRETTTSFSRCRFRQDGAFINFGIKKMAIKSLSFIFTKHQ